VQLIGRYVNVINDVIFSRNSSRAPSTDYIAVALKHHLIGIFANMHDWMTLTNKANKKSDSESYDKII